MVNIKEEAKKFIIDSVGNFLKNKKPPDTFQPLQLIFPEERYTRSIFGGLETSLGTKLWVYLAKHLAKKNQFEILDENDFNLSVPILPQSIENLVNDFNRERLEKKNSLSELKSKLITEIEKINNIKEIGTKQITKSEGVDMWFRKNKREYMYESKTVQINTGGGIEFSKKMCRWHAYRLCQDPQVDLETAVVFPYDPLKGAFFTKMKGRISPLVEGEDAKMGDQFWDFISGQNNTIKKIESAFKEIKKTGELKKYKKIFHLSKKKKKKKKMKKNSFKLSK